MALFLASQREDWLWFEDVLAYDNARLSQAINSNGSGDPYAALRRGRPAIAALADVASNHVVWMLQTRWLQKLRQIRQKPDAFDQQPVEACATISACLAAWRADKGAEWLAGATRAFEWFLGENDLRTA